MHIGEEEKGFRLPVNVDTVYIKLTQQAKIGKVRPGLANREQAARVGWRILKDWTEAQVALIETGMVKVEEVFLPYLLVNKEQTLFQRMQESYFLLPEGNEK